MKKVKYILFFYLIINIIISSQSKELEINVIKPNYIISNPVPTFEMGNVNVGIYILRIDRPNSVLAISYYDWDSWIGSDVNAMVCYGEIINYWDINNKKIIEKPNDFQFEYPNTVIHDASSVVINDQIIILQNAYKVDKDFDKYGGYSRTLESANLSPNNDIIGGTMRIKGRDPSSRTPDEDWYIASLWNAKTGNQIWHEYTPNEDYQPIRRSAPTLNVYFSQDGDFFVARGLSDVPPVVTLIYIPLVQLRGARGDVVFTTDCKYMVTAWETTPLLINTRNQEVIQQYKTESPMTAMAISPDNKTVYIACTDNKIYVFDSHLPTSSTNHWKEQK